MAGYHCLDRTLTGQGWGSTGKRKLLGEREGFCASLDRTRETGRPVPQQVEPVGHSLDRMSFLALKTYPFLFLSFPILRQGL